MNIYRGIVGRGIAYRGNIGVQEVEEEGAGRNVTVSTTIGVQEQRGKEECCMVKVGCLM